MSEQSKGSGGARFAVGSIFVTWVGISALANYAHGQDPAIGLLMAAAPVGFAAVTFVLEMLVSRGHSLGWVAGLAMVMVAAGAGVASYVGLFGLAREHGATKLVAGLIPIAFDGVVLAMSLAMRILSKPIVAKELATPFGHRDVTAMDMAMAKRQAELANEMAKVEMAKDTVEPLAMDVDKTLAKWGVGHTEYTPDDWTGAVATPADVATSQMAMAGEIDSMAAWFDGAERAVDEMAKKVATEAEAYVASAPAPIVKDSSKVPAAEAYTLALTGVAKSDFTLGQISELLGGHYGVSARTIRRQSWWPAVSERPVSAPPAEGVN